MSKILNSNQHVFIVMFGVALRSFNQGFLLSNLRGTVNSTCLGADQVSDSCRVGCKLVAVGWSLGGRVNLAESSFGW